MAGFKSFEAKGIAVVHDIFNGFILGEKLGFGMDREVYVFLPDPEQVIKVETGTGNFQNVVELQVWHECQNNGPIGKQLKRHLAEVFQISECGCWLRMERTYPPPKNYRWPAKMPAALTDFKHSNFGLNKAGRLVCHDYGLNMLMSDGLSNRMRKADWWNY